jgi:hypothetical protein
MPPPADSPDEGPGLIEPEQPAPTVDLNSLDTGRILRDTGSLHLPRQTRVRSPESASEADELEGTPSASSETAPVEDSESSAARSGLNVLSVMSFVLSLTLSPFAMVFGYIAVGQIRRSRQRGEVLAWISVGLGMALDPRICGLGRCTWHHVVSALAEEFLSNPQASSLE